MYLFPLSNRPTRNGMKKPLHTLVTLLCFLALFVPVATLCLPHHPTTQAVCSHCPPHNSVPPCCSAQQHSLPPILTTTNVEPPTLAIATSAPSFLNKLSLVPSHSSAALEMPPPLPLRIALRI